MTGKLGLFSSTSFFNECFQIFEGKERHLRETLRLKRVEKMTRFPPPPGTAPPRVWWLDTLSLYKRRLSIQLRGTDAERQEKLDLFPPTSLVWGINCSELSKERLLGTLDRRRIQFR